MSKILRLVEREATCLPQYQRSNFGEFVAGLEDARVFEFMGLHARKHPKLNLISFMNLIRDNMIEVPIVRPTLLLQKEMANVLMLRNMEDAVSENRR